MVCLANQKAFVDTIAISITISNCKGFVIPLNS